jgi:hypothetical protein
LVFDPVRDGQRGEYGREVGVDRFAFVVVDRPRLQVVLGHPETLHADFSQDPRRIDLAGGLDDPG